MSGTRKPPRPKKRHFVKPRRGTFILFGMSPDRDPKDLCGGRRLRGAEFKARKDELEAREAAARSGAR